MSKPRKEELVRWGVHADPMTAALIRQAQESVERATGLPSSRNRIIVLALRLGASVLLRAGGSVDRALAFAEEVPAPELAQR